MEAVGEGRRWREEAESAERVTILVRISRVRLDVVVVVVGDASPKLSYVGGVGGMSASRRSLIAY